LDILKPMPRSAGWAIKVKADCEYSILQWDRFIARNTVELRDWQREDNLPAHLEICDVLRVAMNAVGCESNLCRLLVAYRASIADGALKRDYRNDSSANSRGAHALDLREDTLKLRAHF
jgi:hypothetical protein